ncbi:MAG: RHS repeat-associated core domain-containing protein [Polyangiaceae bacterium]
MQAPYAKQITTTTGGVTQTITRNRTATYAANDITNVTSMVDQTTINGGETWTSTYQKQAGGTSTWTSSSPLGRQGTITTDASGRPVTLSAPGIAPYTIEYYPWGAHAGRIWKLSQSSNGQTRTSEVVYDAAGNVAQVTSPLQQTTSYTYDANGRSTGATTPDNRHFSLAYDLAGNLSALVPPAPGGDHHFTHDGRNLVAAATQADVGPGDETTYYSYSNDGEPVLATLPSGVTVAQSFDPVTGRLAAISTPQGSMSLTYYSSGAAAGKLESITSTSGATQSLAYSGALMTDVEWTGPVSGTVHLTYDNHLRVATETVSGTPAVTRAWNLDGQLVQAGALQLSYDATTGILQGTTIGSVNDSIVWNAFGEADNYTASSSSQLLSRTFVRDAVGRIASVTEVKGGGAPSVIAYQYDLAGRLTDVLHDGTPAEHYAYDAHGNRTTTDLTGQSSIAATFDAQDRLLAFGAATYTHAVTGERTSKTVGTDTTTYSYDAFGQLTTVTLPDATLIEYLYDASGRRIAKKVDGAFEQRFLYGGGLGPVALVDANGAVVERYVYATTPSAPDYVVRLAGPQTGTYRLIKDERGSVRMVVDTQTGAVVQELTYDGYGRVLTDTNPGFLPFGFAGGLCDADTGLVRFGLRDYDPETGRWTTQDPIGISGGDTNLYAYVAGDPVNWADPTGLTLSGGNPAMDSALNGGLLSWLGFEEFARGAYNYNEGRLKLSNDATFNEGIAQIRQGICQMVGGGIQAVQAGQVAIALTSVASVALKGTARLPRFQGQKPRYSVNEAHVRGSPRFNPRKTPLPHDAAAVFSRAVPDHPVTPRNWYGTNQQGAIYRFSSGNDGTVHFSGMQGSGDGIRNITDYALERLGR